MRDHPTGLESVIRKGRDNTIDDEFYYRLIIAYVNHALAGCRHSARVSCSIAGPNLAPYRHPGGARRETNGRTRLDSAVCIKMVPKAGLEPARAWPTTPSR